MRENEELTTFCGLLKSSCFSEMMKGPVFKEIMECFEGHKTPVLDKIAVIAFSDRFGLFVLGTIFIPLHALLLCGLLKRNRNISKNFFIQSLIFNGQLLYSLSFFPGITLITNRAMDHVLNLVGVRAFFFQLKL